MQGRSQLDSRWLIEQMARVVDGPVPVGSVVNCEPYMRIAQAYVEELVKETRGREGQDKLQLAPSSRRFKA